MVFWKHRTDDVEHTTVVEHRGPTEHDVRAAYERGRKEERRRHKSHPILGLLVFAIAMVGGVMLFLAAREGSFSGAGRVADQQIAEARVEAPAAIRDTAAGARADAGDVDIRSGQGG
ncbi:MAG: hypothetical protein ACXW3D_00305 [Caulobacteraceae bacterium]